MSLPDSGARDLGARERVDGRFPDDGWQDDTWGDAPTETDDPAYDDLLDTHSRSLSTPTYDLGPSTDTFVIDLNAAPPVAAPPVAAAPPSAARHAAPPPGAAPAPEPTALEPAPEHAAAPAVATAVTEPEPATDEPAEDRRRDDLRRELLQVPIAARQGGAESLTAAKVLRKRRARPQSGWRKSVYSMTGGKINFGLSAKDRRRARLVERARTPVTGCHRLAVISLKGGVGKTTTTAALGAMFADLRGDRVIAVDANPDRGTLGERVPRESGATVRHLLAERDQLHRYSDVRAFTSQDRTRLEVLASDSDPHVSAAFSERDYRDTVAILERFYNLVLTDCGTGLLHDAMRGILGLASSLVVVSSASLDGARSASATLDWLEAHGFDHLARNAVVVISSVRPGGGIVDLAELEEHFSARCREVVTIPYDRHLEAGGVLELDELEPKTLDAYRQLAAAVGEAFSSTESSSTAARSDSSRS